jgi:hypothetical protein
VPTAHTSAKLSPKIIAKAADSVADGGFSIGHPRASATHDHELVVLIPRSPVARLPQPTP